MVRLQGDFAKPPEKRLNYKNSIDGLFRVRPRFKVVCRVMGSYLV